MNILHTFTRRALRKNRMRTLVTIIGIVLSMALLTAVIEGAYSGLCYMRGVSVESTGDWHGYFIGLDAETAASVEKQPFIKDVVAVWQTIGYEAQGEDSNRDPILVDALIGNAPLIEHRILKGRMPKNEHEIILSSGLYYSFPDYEIGTTLTIPIGTRISPTGEELTEYDAKWEDETVINAIPRTYTIVGVYHSFDSSVKGMGYRALTKGQGSGETTVFFTVKHPYFFKSIMNHQTISTNWRRNSSLMRLYGAFSDDTLINVLYGLASILVILVMFGSISLIYNAFAISVAERTRQFGILKSTGATKKQIRSSVCYEALLLSTFGIPIGMLVGCVGIGVTLWAIRDVFSVTVPSAETQMHLVLHPIALLLATIISFITVLVSAAIPARRVAKLQPIDAIRSNADVKINAGITKPLYFTEKMFGFEGAMGVKNFKRNKKSYRATVLSLFMSVVLFISASSFCMYLADMIEATSMNSNVDVFAYVPTVCAEDWFAELRSFDGVTHAAYVFQYSGNDVFFLADPELLTDESIRLIGTVLDDSSIGIDVCLVYMDNDSFRMLCKQNGLESDPYFAEDCPYGVLMNTAVSEKQENNRTRYYRYDLFQNNALPAFIYMEAIQERDGCNWVYYNDAERSETMVIYFPKDYYEQQKQDYYDINAEDLDFSKAEAIIPVSEAIVTETFSFDAFVESDDFCIGNESASLIYPFAKLPEQYKNETDQVQMLFQTTDHKGMTKALNQFFAESDLDSYIKNNCYVGDIAEQREQSRMYVAVVNVFTYGFIVLISLIAVANVFNTISTSIMLRRREFAMLKSIGMTDQSMLRMLSYECLIYGVRSLLFGLPVSIGITLLIHSTVTQWFQHSLYIPWHSILIAVGSVFLVVFTTMLYARSKLKKDNPIDALKNENL